MALTIVDFAEHLPNTWFLKVKLGSLLNNHALKRAIVLSAHVTCLFHTNQTCWIPLT